MASPAMKLHISLSSSILSSPSRSTATARATVKPTAGKQIAALASSKAGHIAPFPSSITTTTITTRPSKFTGDLPVRASIFPFAKKKNRKALKEELLQAIAPLDRGADASPDDQSRIEQIAQSLESTNPTKDTLKSPLLSGKWELLYTTSASILKTERPKFLRPRGPIFQAINTDTLRAQNVETWPFFNQVTANLTPLSGKKVAVKFDVFKIGGLISIKAPDRARGELEITFVDEELRISRGDKGNLFVLKMVDPSYRVPT